MSGEQQSPINLENPFQLAPGSIDLEICWQEQLSGTPYDSGHGISVMFVNDGSSFIRFGGKAYSLHSFHFHHPSEHVVAGQRQFMELHIVHQNLHDATRLVIAVFLDAEAEEPVKKSKTTKTPSPSTAFLTNVAKSLARKTRTGSVDPITTDPRVLLPPEEFRKDFWHYMGSLTTDPYTENVTWIVMQKSVNVIASKAAELIKTYKTHYRDLQPLNRRLIVSHVNRVRTK